VNAQADGPVALVVAKVPVPGFAKTRLAATVGDAGAADLAAAALLDTIAACHATGWPVVVALTGEPAAAARADAITSALAGCTVLSQRGAGFGERLAAAHADALAAMPNATAVLQVGMDTPQLRAEHLTAALELLKDHEAVLGPATDGGWWLLGLRDPWAAACLTEVPMSTDRTGAATVEALQSRGLRVAATVELLDVDDADDAARVAGEHPGLRFSTGWRVLTAPQRLRLARPPQEPGRH